MADSIIVALISTGASLVVCLVNNYFSAKKVANEHTQALQDVSASQQQSIALIEFRIDELKRSVEKHNSVVERVYHLEQVNAVQEEQIKVANKRIADLERVGD